ncbi:MAG: methyltransferase domain-containing protein [Gemmobacter sp.]
MNDPRSVHLRRFLARFDLIRATGLEIGPFDRPVFLRTDYPNILYVDVKDTETLIHNARVNPRRDPARVVKVDYVLHDRPLDAVVPPASLDFVFCSHVLEHVPDLVGHLKSVARILKSGGLFLVAYPDRRFTFDIMRPATTLDQLRDRHARGVKKPDPETVEEQFAANRTVRVGRLWQGLPDAIGPPNFTPEHARWMAERAQREYIDVHCNVFSDAELGETLQTLAATGEQPLLLDVLEPTRAPLMEFYLALRNP